jgi:hypothetical protein
MRSDVTVESRFGDGSTTVPVHFEVQVGAGRAAPRPETGEYQTANEGNFYVMSSHLVQEQQTAVAALPSTHKSVPPV